MPLLSVADVFLLPSAQESFGLAALEAMACEVPVVASRVGGLPEVIDDGVSGFLHAPDDLDGMADSAVRLLTDDALRESMARAARRTVRESGSATRGSCPCTSRTMRRSSPGRKSPAGAPHAAAVLPRSPSAPVIRAEVYSGLSSFDCRPSASSTAVQESACAGCH